MVLLFIEAVYLCLERVFDCENDLVIKKSIVITADYFSYVPYLSSEGNAFYNSCLVRLTQATAENNFRFILAFYFPGKRSISEEQIMLAAIHTVAKPARQFGDAMQI